MLFQFFSIQIVLGFYQSAAAQDLPAAIPVVQAKPPTANIPTKAGLPVRLTIPKIKVSALIRSVGLAPDGSMGVPKVPRDTAWYNLGPKPGDTGSAVIAGHVNWLYGAKGVFEHLSTLKPGDIITVQDDKGVTTKFKVRTTRTYGNSDDATDVFRSFDGIAHLNLVTCGGVWDKVKKMYTKRLVVFADKVTE